MASYFFIVMCFYFPLQLVNVLTVGGGDTPIGIAPHHNCQISSENAEAPIETTMEVSTEATAKEAVVKDTTKLHCNCFKR